MKVVITKKKGLPRHQIQGLVDCPVGMKRDPMTGQCVQDLTFDESTIPRPPVDEVDASIPSQEAQRFSAVVGDKGLYGNERITASELDKIWKMGDDKQPSFTKTISNLEKAAMLTAFLQGVGSTLQASQQEETARKREIKRGMSDNYFPTVPYYASRGTTEINTGEMFPNMQVPVQFPGTRVAPYYGQFQLGALVPSIPFEVEEATPRFPAYIEESVNPVTENITDVSTPSAASSAAAPVSNVSSAMIDENLSLPLDPYAFKFSSGYGKRTAPKSGASTDHNGVDLAATAGSNIYSIKPGTVYQQWSDKKGGNQLIIKHDDGTTSGYAHLENFAAKEGDRVNAGSVIGYVGSTGVATGPHLHFTYRDASGNRIDPTTIFDFKAYSRTSKASKANTGFSGQVSYTHNNPLNIHHGRFTSNYGATKGAYDNSGNVAVFPDLNTGIQAAKDLLFSPNSSYYNLKISEARNRWVNGSADQPSESTKHIVKAMGKDTSISQLTPAEKDKLLKLFAKWEGKQGYNAIKDMSLFKEGGEYELTDDEIDYILANGGEIEYL